jgi:hypothetical protein
MSALRSEVNDLSHLATQTPYQFAFVTHLKQLVQQSANYEFQQRKPSVNFRNMLALSCMPYETRLLLYLNRDEFRDNFFNVMTYVYCDHKHIVYSKLIIPEVDNIPLQER